MVRCVFLMVMLAFSTPPQARAEGPEALVQWIYTSLTHPVAPEQKGFDYVSNRALREQYFSDRMIAFFEANESYGDDLAAACIDFGLAIPGQDFDSNEIARTLSTEEAGDASQKTVVARFTNFGQPAEIVYDFVVVDGYWRIDDMAGRGWRVSQIPCQPKQSNVAPVPQVTGASYCYQRSGEYLKIDVDGAGGGRVEMQSFQANGHSCSAAGPIKKIDGGWVYEEELDGGLCRIEFLVTPEQGIRLTDADWVCKRSLCGQRAVMDGLTFPLESQVHCAVLNRN